MSEGAPVNTGAVEWPDPDSAYFAVRKMQTKLYRWATEDHGRRFGDLFNLVYDPAFLVHAWERVSTNRARGPQVSTGPLRPRSRPGWGSRLSWASSGTR
jgi:RNA-directed DNA polymerase